MFGPHKDFKPRQFASDGQRARAIWRAGDGDGDGEPYHIERIKHTKHGHPTWMFYIENTTTPIVRGSEEEPPHYVYLDDRACFDIWSSNAYTGQERCEFWPFDFDKQGNVRSGRPNRGNPSYADEANKKYNVGKVRIKAKTYTFSGAPQVTPSKPTASIWKSNEGTDNLAPYIVAFSSRGPNPVTPSILKVPNVS